MIGLILLILGIGFLVIFLLPTVFTIALTVLFIYVFYRIFRYVQDKVINKDI